MSTERPRLRFLLDEGAPRSVGRYLESRGHDVIYFDAALMPGSPDVLVAKTAEANDAILIALDGDMKTLAKRAGIGGGRFKRLSLLKLSCREPTAAQRVEQAISLIENEWTISDAKAARRLFVEIGDAFIKTFR